MTDEAGALAVYGSLMPGEKNHWVLRSIEGDWVPGIARGFEFEITWGAAEGYEGFLPDDDGNHVSVMVLLSNRLDKNWRSVDEFHGEGFVRQIVPITLGDENVIHAWMYMALTDT
ncbi:MAG: gamma-glutamylcyclotransferase family protein [Acidimicrobiia bacterium]|nr:gamma-glutamylcyclotransferase family protein [Acidimicrobiia bacterium]